MTTCRAWILIEGIKSCVQSVLLTELNRTLRWPGLHSLSTNVGNEIINKKTLTFLASVSWSHGHCLQRARSKKTAHARRRGHHITSTYLSWTTLAQRPNDKWQLYAHSTSNPAPKRFDISLFAIHELHGGESTPVTRTTFVTVGIDPRVNEN